MMTLGQPPSDVTSFQFDPTLWSPQRRTLERVIGELDAGANCICVYSPTGTGKTRMSMELFRYANHHELGGNFYINRKLLIGQTYHQMQQAGLWSGIRAAEYDDEFDDGAPFQVTSAPSEDKRVFKSGRWDMHDVEPGGIVIIDEAHIQKTKAMRKITDWYIRQGAKVVLVTATPVDMRGWADRLIVSGSLQEWRECGALVPVVTTTVSQPDLRKVKRNKTGEYVLDGKKKRIFTQSIVGDVINSFERLHETGPTMLYCPGVSESIWLTSQLGNRGHKFIHVDATKAVIDGEEVGLTRTLWEEIVESVKSGDVAGLSSRFKLREGVDIPSASHCILATPVGSLASYLQIVGRVMRGYRDPASGFVKSHAILQCHGGAYHQHGSPNHDRDWESLWQLREHAASSLHLDQIREGAEPEPIRCPECGAERMRGPKCHVCGFQHKKSVRRIMEEDGTMHTVKGDLVPRTVRIQRSDTEQLWTRLYYGYRNKKVDQSFSQMEAFFFRTHGYRPSRDLPFMPRNAIGWKEKVHEVPMSSLIGKGKEKLH